MFQQHSERISGLNVYSSVPQIDIYMLSNTVVEAYMMRGLGICNAEDKDQTSVPSLPLFITALNS